MVTLTQAQTGILRFVEREIAPNLSTMEKIVVGGAINLVSGKLPTLIGKYADNKLFSALEIYDKEQGRIDLDALYNAVKPYLGNDQIPVPVRVPVIGVDLNLKFTQRDVDTLYRYIKEA